MDQIGYYKKVVKEIREDTRISDTIAFSMKIYGVDKVNFKEFMKDKKKVYQLVSIILEELGIERPTDCQRCAVLSVIFDQKGVKYVIYAGVDGGGSIPNVVFIEAGEKYYCHNDIINSKTEVFSKCH